MESFGKNYKYDDDFSIEDDFTIDPYSEIPEYIEYVNDISIKPQKKLGKLRKLKQTRDNFKF